MEGAQAPFFFWRVLLSVENAPKVQEGQPGLLRNLSGRLFSGVNMEEFTISQLQDKMRNGELTSRRSVELYLERIQGPSSTVWDR